MKPIHIFATGRGFRVLETTERSQTGVLTLDPGEASSETPSAHEDSDRTLILLAGELRAETGDEKILLEDGDAELIPATTPHRFINTGRSLATTFNVYARPAFPPTDDL